MLSDDNFNEDLANMIKNFTIINLVPREKNLLGLIMVDEGYNDDKYFKLGSFLEID